MLEPTTQRVLLEHIVQAAEACTGFSKRRLRSEDRTQPLVHVRHACMVLAHYYTDLSIAGIGRYFRRDHTTVLNALRRGQYGRTQRLHWATISYISGIDARLQDWQQSGELVWTACEPPLTCFELQPPGEFDSIDCAALEQSHA